jgi:hypothetical protein
MILPVQGTIRDEYDGILEFSRPSVAYDAQGRRYDPGQMRFEPGRFGMAVRVEEGTVNTDSGTPDVYSGAVFAHSVQSGGQFDRWHRLDVTKVGRNKFVASVARIGVPDQGAATWQIEFWCRSGLIAPYITGQVQVGLMASVDGGRYVKTWTNTTGAPKEQRVFFRHSAAPSNDPFDFDDVIFYRFAQAELKPYPTTFVVGERQPELLTIPMSVLDSVNPTNLLTGNHSNGGENGTTSGLRPTGAYTSSSDEVAWEGTRSFRITTKGEFDHEGVFTDYDAVRVVPGRTYSIRARVYGVSGVVRAVLRFLVDGTGRDTFSPSITLDGSWQEATVTAVAPENAANASLMIRVTGTQVITFYIDGLQLNEGDPVDWCLGGHRLLLGPSEGTIEGWIYVDDTMRRNAGDYRQLWHIPLPGVKGTWALALYQMGTTSKYYVGVRPQPSEHQTTSFDYADVSEGWHYFGVSWGSGTTEICVDGVKRGEIAAVPSQLGEVLAIGGRADNLFHTNTLHDDIRLSSVKRSAAEQLAIFDSGQPAPYDEHTTYLWRADGPSAQRVTRAVVL